MKNRRMPALVTNLSAARSKTSCAGRAARVGVNFASKRATVELSRLPSSASVTSGWAAALLFWRELIVSEFILLSDICDLLQDGELPRQIPADYFPGCSRAAEASAS